MGSKYAEPDNLTARMAILIQSRLAHIYGAGVAAHGDGGRVKDYKKPRSPFEIRIQYYNNAS